MDDAFVHQPRGFGQDFALPFDVCRFAQWAGKHKFPMQRQAFAFERVHIQRFGVVNQRDSALRGDEFAGIIIEIYSGFNAFANSTNLLYTGTALAPAPPSIT